VSSLKVEIKDQKAFLAGSLDENSDLTPLESVSGDFMIHFGSVERVNSCGVREWVNLLKKLSSVELKYEACPIVVVKQLNAVPDFQGGAKVHSFYAPYFCEDTDEEEVKLLEVSQVVNGEPPELKNESGQELIFDAIPSQYFGFLSRT